MKPCINLAKVAAVTACTMLLTACVSSQMPMSPASDSVDAAPPPPTVTTNGPRQQQVASCQRDAIQYAMGKPFKDTMVSQLKSASRAQQVRILRPGDAATMDHRPDRLTIHLDAQDNIEALRCG